MKRKDLFMPNDVDKAFQSSMMSIISSTPSRKKVEKLMPKIRRIEGKMKRRITKEELERLMKE